MQNLSLHMSRRWRSLLCSVALLIIGFSALPQESAAQTLCDAIGVSAKVTENCCFRFVFENGQRDVVINRVVLNVVGQTYSVQSASGSQTATTTNTSTSATWSFANGLPARTDAPVVCFTSNLGAPTNRPFTVIINWYSGDRGIVCTDTLELDCSNTTGDGCITISNQEIACKTPPTPNGQGTFTWCFTVKNISNMTINTIQVGNNTVNVGAIPPGTSGRVCVTLTGQPGSTIAVGILACNVKDSVRGENGFVDTTTTRTCCDTRVEVTLPKCEPTNKCFDIIEQQIECQRENGAISYLWCFSFRNLTNFTVNQVRVGNSVVSINPVQPGGTGRACVTLYGQPGATAFGVLICRVGDNNSAGGRDTLNILDSTICCEQRVELVLPKCEEGCFELVEQEILCDSTGGYIWCFNVRNQANWNMGGFSLDPLQNSAGGRVTISPNYTVFDRPIQPGGLSPRICVRITGAAPGTLVLNGLNCADLIDVCCDQRIEIKLPECKPVGRECCDGFNIVINQSRAVAAQNGFTGVIGLVGAGPAAIKKASATLVYSTVNGQPAYGYAVNGLLLNPFGVGTVTPPGFGQEIIWTNPAGVNMNAPAFSLNWFRFPPMAPNARTDTLRFCIRWRFTDAECRTCDTIVCYTTIRRNFFGGNGTGSQIEKGSATQGGDGSISGTLTGQNSGSITMILPELPEEEFGKVTFTGLSIQAGDNVAIAGVTDADGKYTFTTDIGIAMGDINATAGEQLNLNIQYANLGNRTSLEHFLLLSYETDLLPGQPLEIPVTVTLRKSGSTGGDNVTAVSAEISGKTVKTYALHVRNTNKTGEALSGLRLTASDGMEFLAVGPTSRATEALLRFGVNGERGRAYISEAAEGTVQLQPGAERKPIYVTIASNGEYPPVIEYTTLNGSDEEVSRGVLNLEEISSVGHAGGSLNSISQMGHVWPNPATGTASLSLQMTQSEKVTLVVRDALGKEITKLFDSEMLEAGSHVVSFEVSDLPSGTYYFTLQTPTGTETRTLTVTK